MEDDGNGPNSRGRNSQIKICNSLLAHAKFIKTKGINPPKNIGIIVQ